MAGRLPPSPAAARQAALEHQITYLSRRLEGWQALSRRYAWWRLGLFLAGGAATWAAATAGGPLWGTLTFGVAAGVFFTVVHFHQRLDAWIEKFRFWRDLRREQLARLTLDWDKIPPSTLPPDRRPTPLEIDLDLCGPRSLHQLIDTARSRAGSRTLADWLATSIPDPAQVAARQATVRELAGLPRFRDRLWLTFRLVSQEQLEGEKLLHWLTADYPAERLGGLLLAATGLVAANLVLFALNSLGYLPAWWPLSLAVYVAFYFLNSSRLGKFLEAVVQLNDELGKFNAVFNYLETYPYAGHPHLGQLCAPFCAAASRPSARLKQVLWVTAAVGLRASPILGILLNLILPWDFACAWLAGRRRAEMARWLPLWLETCHTLEALVSLANFAHLNPGYTFPDLVAGGAPAFAARALGHPLLPPAHKVCNDFTLPAAGALAILTGSNMAGKSTFLKAVGVNLCLAYAGGPVNAAQLCVAPLRLYTCLRITDSVTDGFSYFYAEVKRLKGLLEALRAENPWPVLYLIDEIFRGTNNRERLIGSRAYVRALLGANGLGLLATHDLELATLAEHSPQAQNFHFRDAVEAGRLVFDYTLRPGPCPTTNALQIMLMEGLPVEASDAS